MEKIIQGESVLPDVFGSSSSEGVLVGEGRGWSHSFPLEQLFSYNGEVDRATPCVRRRDVLYTG